MIREATQIAVDVVASSNTIGGVAVVGTVGDAGEHARALLGTSVLVGPLDPCGECDVCRRGGAAVCPTAIRRSTADACVIASARYAVPLDELDLPMPAAAAIAGDVALAYTLYARTGLGPREPVVVVGASPIARFLLEILTAKAIKPVHATLAMSREQVAMEIAAQGIAGRGWRLIAAGIDGETIRHAAALAPPRATLTVLAPVEVLPPELAAREIAIIPVAGAHPDLVVEVAAMCAKGEIDLARGTSETENTDMRTVVRWH